MKKFVLDVALFLGLHLVVLAWLVYRYNMPADYLAAVNDKLDRLEQRESPQIILTGGSSVAYGSHSQLIKDAFGMNVENLGYHAGVGLNYRIEELKQLTRPGDVVVVSIEWGTFGIYHHLHPGSFSEVVLGCPRCWSFMGFEEKQDFFDGLLPTLRAPFTSFVSDLRTFGLRAFERVSREDRRLSRSGFNDFGDYVKHYTLDAPGIRRNEMYLPTREQLNAGIDRLNEVNAELKKQNIRLFYFVPWVPDSMSDEERLEIIEQLDDLKTRLQFPVLNPDHYLVEESAFYDSIYHLKEEPGRTRTELLISRLRPYLSAP